MMSRVYLVCLLLDDLANSLDLEVMFTGSSHTFVYIETGNSHTFVYIETTLSMTLNPDVLIVEQTYIILLSY